MQQTILVTGLACLIAAIVGGGLKAFGIEIPLLSSRVRQFVLGLFGLILIATGIMPSIGMDGFTSRNGGKSIPNGIDRHRPHSGGTISVRCTASPHAIPAGGKVEIRVLAFTEQSAPVPNANVRIESGGGWFSGSGTTTEVGMTDAIGVFTTQWRAPKPAAAAYGMGVSANKEGFTEGKVECQIPIQ
jgi:hypothetical protein